MSTPENGEGRHLDEFYNGYLERDRRSRNRRRLQMPVRLDVFLKEVEEDPEELVGVAQNFTPVGMQVSVENLSHTIFEIILKTKPECIVEFANPTSRKIVKLHGKVIWGHYHLKSVPRPQCNMGISLREVDPEVVEQIKKYFMHR